MASVDQPFATALTDFGGAVSSLFGARGATASASSYDQAAALAEQNALIAKQSTNIKETQLSRQIFQVTGKARAAIGGAGFAESGSALDILRSSASQGALAKAITANEGAISENSYAQQAGMYSGLAGAARTTSKANTVGGIIQGAGGALSLYNGISGLFKGGADATSAASTASAAAAADLAAGGSAVGSVAAGTADIGVGVGASGIAEGGAAVAAETGAAAAAEGFAVEELAALALCFITTAITKALGKPDDCDELETLRAFRDDWLTANHPADIAEYYRIAPGIVAAIDRRADAAEVWANLYVDYLVPALDEIEDDNNEEAYRIYRRMVSAAQGAM